MPACRPWSDGTRAGCGAHALEHEVGTATTVMQAQRATGDARCLRVDDEQRDAVSAAAIAGDARTHEQAVCRVAVRHQHLRAAQPPAVAFTLRRAAHVMQAVVRFGLAVCPCDRRLSRDDRRHPARQLSVACRAQRRRTDHHRRQQRTQRQRPRDGLEHQHRVDRRAVEPAVNGRVRQGEQPDLGITRPQRAAETLGAAQLLLSPLEAAVARHQSLDAVLQHALVVVQLEVHEAPKALRAAPPRGGETTFGRPCSGLIARAPPSRGCSSAPRCCLRRSTQPAR